MTPKLAAIAATALLAVPAATLAAVPTMYRYDTAHSQVYFSVDHNGFSRPLGRLHVAGGWLRVDTDDLGGSATELDIDLASVDMGDPTWNQALLADTWLDTANTRYAHFVSTSVEVIGPRQGILHGTLTLRGKTVPVNIAFTLNRHGMTIFSMQDTIGFSAKAVLDRRAFGMTANAGSIGERVDLRLEIEAVYDTQARKDYNEHHPPASGSSVNGAH